MYIGGSEKVLEDMLTQMMDKVIAANVETYKLLIDMYRK